MLRITTSSKRCNRNQRFLSSCENSENYRCCGGLGRRCSSCCSKTKTRPTRENLAEQLFNFSLPKMFELKIQNSDGKGEEWRSMKYVSMRRVLLAAAPSNPKNCMPWNLIMLPKCVLHMGDVGERTLTITLMNGQLKRTLYAKIYEPCSTVRSALV